MGETPRRVRYTGASDAQVNWGGNDDPRGHLNQGEVYVVENTDVHDWHTKISLRGFPGMVFNDASFDYL